MIRVIIDDGAIAVDALHVAANYIYYWENHHGHPHQIMLLQCDTPEEAEWVMDNLITGRDEVDIRPDVVYPLLDARQREATTTGLKWYDVEVYELHSQVYRVKASSPEDAAGRVNDGLGEIVDGGTDYIEVASLYHRDDLPEGIRSVELSDYELD